MFLEFRIFKNVKLDLRKAPSKWGGYDVWILFYCSELKGKKWKKKWLPRKEGALIFKIFIVCLLFFVLFVIEFILKVY